MSESQWVGDFLSEGETVQNLVGMVAQPRE